MNWFFSSRCCVFFICAPAVPCRAAAEKLPTEAKKLEWKKNTHHPHMSPSTSTFLPLPNDTVAECTLIHHRHIRRTNQSSWSIRFADRSRRARSFRCKEFLCQWKFDENMCVRVSDFHWNVACDIDNVRLLLFKFSTFHSREMKATLQHTASSCHMWAR